MKGLHITVLRYRKTHAASKAFIAYFRRFCVNFKETKYEYTCTSELSLNIKRLMLTL